MIRRLLLVAAMAALAGCSFATPNGSYAVTVPPGCTAHYNLAISGTGGGFDATGDCKVPTTSAAATLKIAPVAQP